MSDSFCGDSRRVTVDGRKSPFGFCDYGSMAVPSTWQEVYRWAHAVRTTTSDFGMAIRRLYGFFATEVEFHSLDEEVDILSERDRKNWVKVFESLAYLEHAVQLGENVALYGADIVTVQQRFVRHLLCDACDTAYEFMSLVSTSSSQFEYHPEHFAQRKSPFVAKCINPSCRNRRVSKPMKALDFARTDQDSVWLKHWDIDHIQVEEIAGEQDPTLWWTPSPRQRTLVSAKHVETLATLERGILNAIATNTKYRFNRSMVFYGRELSYGGHALHGHGMPKSLLCAREIWRLHMIRRVNQVIAADYLLPMRVMSRIEAPSADPYQRDWGVDVPMEQFTADVDAMVRSHRIDPTRLHAMPYDFRYQLVGAEASSLAPAEHENQAKEALYDAIGLPLELFVGSLDKQGTVAALRLMMNTHSPIVSMYNRFSQFVARRVAEIRGQPPIDARHQKVSIADSMERMSLINQLVQTGQADLQTLVEPYGLSAAELRYRRIAEEIENMKAQKRLEQETIAAQVVTQTTTPAQPPPPPQGAAGASGGGGGGAPPPGGGAPMGQPMPQMLLPSQGYKVPPGASVEQLAAEAEAMAGLLLTIPSDAQRKQEIGLLRQDNPQFPALVNEQLRRQRQSTNTQGGQLLRSGQI